MEFGAFQMLVLSFSQYGLWFVRAPLRRKPSTRCVSFGGAAVQCCRGRSAVPTYSLRQLGTLQDGHGFINRCLWCHRGETFPQLRATSWPNWGEGGIPSGPYSYAVRTPSTAGLRSRMRENPAACLLVVLDYPEAVGPGKNIRATGRGQPSGPQHTFLRAGAAQISPDNGPAQ